MKFLLGLIAVLMVMVSSAMAADNYYITTEKYGDKYELFVLKGDKKIHHVNQDIELYNEPCVMWDNDHWYVVNIEKARLVRNNKGKFDLFGDVVTFKVYPSNTIAISKDLRLFDHLIGTCKSQIYWNGNIVVDQCYDKNKFISEYKSFKKLTNVHIHKGRLENLSNKDKSDVRKIRQFTINSNKKEIIENQEYDIHLIEIVDDIECEIVTIIFHGTEKR